MEEKRSKLEPVHALQICILFDQGYGLKQIAAIYGVSKWCVYRITNGQAWQDVTGRKMKDTIKRNKRLGRTTQAPMHFGKAA